MNYLKQLELIVDYNMYLLYLVLELPQHPHLLFKEFFEKKICFL